MTPSTRSAAATGSQPDVHVTVSKYDFHQPSRDWPTGVVLVYDAAGRFVDQFDNSRFKTMTVPCPEGADFTARVITHADAGATKYETLFTFTATGNEADHGTFWIGPGITAWTTKSGVENERGFCYGISVARAVPADDQTEQARLKPSDIGRMGLVWESMRDTDEDDVSE